MRASTFAGAAVLLLACASASAQDVYSLDGTHTTPMYEVRHMGMSLQRGWFTDVQGRVTLDRAARKGTIDVVIGTASVTTSSRILNDVLKRDDYFNVERYPAMRFTSTDLVFDGDVPVAANGQLTLLGVTKPVALSISDFHCGTHLLLRRAMCAAEVRATIRRSEFGMTGGLPNVAGDEVRVVIPVEAVSE
ncbi:MAG: polyisoprenoid-binding protein [Burkholderiales bacterium]|nr:polyisoprenoid-binding protein [Burkholderiales bacterium]